MAKISLFFLKKIPPYPHGLDGIQKILIIMTKYKQILWQKTFNYILKPPQYQGRNGTHIHTFLSPCSRFLHWA